MEQRAGGAAHAEDAGLAARSLGASSSRSAAGPTSDHVGRACLNNVRIVLTKFMACTAELQCRSDKQKAKYCRQLPQLQQLARSIRSGHAKRQLSPYGQSNADGPFRAAMRRKTAGSHSGGTSARHCIVCFGVAARFELRACTTGVAGGAPASHMLAQTLMHPVSNAKRMMHWPAVVPSKIAHQQKQTP